MTDLTIREGKSLRKRIFDDKFESKEGGAKTPMGKCYYAELRGMYGASSCPAQQLDVKNEDEAEDPRLIGALTGLFQRKKTFDRILEWLASAEMVNQKNFVALLRACSSFSPASTMDHLRLALAVMEYCAKHSVLKRYPFEMGVMTPYFAAALVKSYLNFKKHASPRPSGGSSTSPTASSCCQWPMPRSASNARAVGQRRRSHWQRLCVLASSADTCSAGLGASSPPTRSQ